MDNTVKDKIAKTIYQIFENHIRDDFEQPIGDIPIFELGIDSLEFFEKILYLEEQLGCVFALEDIQNNITLNELIALVDDVKQDAV